MGLIASGSTLVYEFLNLTSVVGRCYLGTSPGEEEGGLSIGYQHDQCTLRITPSGSFSKVSFRLTAVNSPVIVEFYRGNTLLESRPVGTSDPTSTVPVTFSNAAGFSHFTLTPGPLFLYYERIVVTGVMTFS